MCHLIRNQLVISGKPTKNKSTLILRTYISNEHFKSTCVYLGEYFVDEITKTDCAQILDEVDS